MEFREIIRGFGEKLGIDGLSPDETNACHVDIDDMTVSFMENPETATVVTWAEICEPPENGEGLLYRVLMESMFMGRGTAGSSFSVESESGKIFLHRVDSTAALDLDSFCAMLETFVNTLERWRAMIADFRPVVETVREADAEAAQMTGYGVNGFMQV